MTCVATWLCSQDRQGLTKHDWARAKKSKNDVKCRKPRPFHVHWCIASAYLRTMHCIINIYIYTYLTKIFFLQGQSGGEFGGTSLNAVVWETSTTSTLFRLFLGSSDATRPVAPCECSAKLLETREVQFCMFLVMGQAFTIIHYCILY